MTDHIARYEPILQALCDVGYLSFGYDHLGHGRTARDASELGYIAPRQGDDFLCRDVKRFSDAVIAAYSGEKRLPYYLLGHSMGSFVTRLAVEKYVSPDKYICMGTGRGNPGANPGLAILAIMKALRGDRYISSLAQKLCFGSYSKRFGGSTPADPSPWLTKDEAVRERYYADPFCSFSFTVSAMGDLIRLNRNSNRPAWYEKVPKSLPILLLSGDADPVGDYGKGVRQVYEKLRKSGHDVRIKLYPNARHEILNDDCCEQVKEDILAFLEG